MFCVFPLLASLSFGGGVVVVVGGEVESDLAVRTLRWCSTLFPFVRKVAKSGEIRERMENPLLHAMAQPESTRLPDSTGSFQQLRVQCYFRCLSFNCWSYSFFVGICNSAVTKKICFSWPMSFFGILCNPFPSCLHFLFPP